MSACEKGDLFKTELCENWVKKGMKNCLQTR